MTELEQINEKLNKILALLQPKKVVQASNSLDEVRKSLKVLKPYEIDFKIDPSQINEGWDYLKLPNGSFGFYDRKSYLKALEEWKANNNI